MLHELGHCFDLDHSVNGIMQRGGDDINMLFAFPPRHKDLALHSNKRYELNQKQDTLSVFQISTVIMLEEEAAIEKDLTIPQGNNDWGCCDSITETGHAFWGTEISEFLSLHR